MGKKKPASQSSLLTRKILRKQNRQKKKLNRQEHYTKKIMKQVESKRMPGQFVKIVQDVNCSQNTRFKRKKRDSSSVFDIYKKEREKDLIETERLKTAMDGQRKDILIKANEEEDKMIKKLEKQLGLNKIKNKQSFFSDDGLDYLLELCDKTSQEQILAAEKQLANVDGESDFEDDLAAVTGKKINNGKSKKDEKKIKKQMAKNELSGIENDVVHNEEELNDSDASSETSRSSIDENSSAKYSENDLSDSEELDSNNSISEEKVSSLSKGNNDYDNYNDDGGNDDIDDNSDENNDNNHDDSLDEDLNSDGDEDNFKDTKHKPDVWEDIYGRKRDKEGNIIKEEKGIYIPPHLRKKDSNSEKELALVKKQIKSVLNKLTGTNLHWACTTIENLYSCNSRNSVNTALTDLWVEATVQYTVTKDRMTAEHAALIAVLHANVGMEVGAHFLQVLANMFDRKMLENTTIEDKRLNNLIAALSHLYSFKIFHACLLYDVLDRLLEKITEKNIECVLIALRCVGGVLRKEEPLALKTFIQSTQSKVVKLTEDVASGSRIKFLLEVLMAVKNNNLTKIPNYDPSYTDELKKLTKGIIRRGNYITSLNIRLEDLLKAEERGKWWVVGSAWEGSHVRDSKDTSNQKKPLANFDQKLVELARKQRMNTDIRRSIFCVIMSAEDYMDAFEKLQHLGLKGQQEREIVHVLMACCLQEKKYNPYYGVLAQKLCDFERKYQLCIQYSVWDKIKELAGLSKQTMGNLAQFLTHLFMEKGLPLSILKVIEFSDLNKTIVKFMRQILLAVIMNADLKAALEVFQRISVSPKLHMFRESLRLFIQHFLIRNAGKKTSFLSEEEMEILKERAVEVDKILSMHDSKLRL